MDINNIMTIYFILYVVIFYIPLVVFLLIRFEKFGTILATTNIYIMNAILFLICIALYIPFYFFLSIFI